MVKKLKIFLRQTSSKQHVFGVLIIIAIAFCVAAPMISFMPKTAQAYETQAYDAYKYYKAIVIESDYVQATLVNRSVLIHDNTGNLLNNVLSNASDIAFFAVGNSTQYNHEIEYFNASTGELWAWVNVTSVSSATDTLFYMYYNDSDGVYSVGHNPTEVWDSDYVFVMHMNDSLGESSGGGWTITDSGAYNTTGAVAGAQYFDGASYILINDNASLEHQSYTIEGWVDADVSATTAIITKIKQANPWTPYAIYILTDTPKYKLMNQVTSGDSDQVHGTTNYTFGWLHFGTTADDTANELRWYGNESLQNVTTDASYGALANDGNIVIGARYTGSYGMYFTGRIDELRYSKTVRSGAWLNFSFHSVNETTGFLTLGSQQEPTDPSVYTIVGLPNDIITWAGTAGNTVYCNSTGDHNEFLELNMSINTTDNVTEIRIFMDDLNDTGTHINASNITLYVANASNNTFYSFGTFTDGGSNISINKTTWNTNIGTDNPFNGTGLKDTNTSIFLIFKLAIPSSSPTDVFWSSSSTAWKIYLGYYT